MTRPAWRLALVAALACLPAATLKAIDPAVDKPTSSAEPVAPPVEPNGPGVPASANAAPAPLQHASPLAPQGLDSVSSIAADRKPAAERGNALATPAPLRASPPAPGLEELGRLLGYITLLAALAGAAIYLIKFGLPLRRGRSKEERKLQVLEMRPLGNRQFLIVVGYEETRMLLGVTPGKIDYLCPLDSTAASQRDFSTLMSEPPAKTSNP